MNTFTVDGTLTVLPVNACLPAKVNDITMHFRFNVAQQVYSPPQFTEYLTHMNQQVHYPSDPRPMYSHRNVPYLVCAIPRQVGFH